VASRGAQDDPSADAAAAARVEALLAQANQLASASLSKLDRRPAIRARWLAAGLIGSAVVLGAVALSLAGGGAAESATSDGRPGAISVDSSPSGSDTTASRPDDSAAPDPSSSAAATATTSAPSASAPSPSGGSESEPDSGAGSTVPDVQAAAPVADPAPLDELRVLDASMLFEVDAHALRPEALPALEELVAFVAEHPQATLEIVGHTDSAGSEPYNLALSIRRAEAVVAYLVERGADPARLTAVGMGESQPIADNATKEGRAANRRIDVHVRDLGSA